MALFNHLHLNKKLWLIIFISMMGMVALIVTSVFSARRSFLMEKKLETRHLVEVAWSQVNFYYQRAKSGEFSEQEAQQRAVAAIRGMRYEKAEYFWINDMQARVIMHPIMATLEGKDVRDLKDSTGKRLFTEFVETVRKNGDGYVFYLWPRPGETQPVLKLSYVKGFQPWGWVIGSGIYIDDLNSTFWKAAGPPALISSLVLVAILAISWLLARNIAYNEESLRVSEEKYARAFQISPDGIAISRKQDGLLLEVNDALAAMFGFKKQEVIGHTTLDLKIWLSENDRAHLIDLMDQQQQVVNHELRLRARSGNVLTVLWSSNLISLGGEECLFTLIRDITADKERERTLQKSKAELTIKHEQLAGMYAQVEKAKSEWERTMDSLHEMVLLLDGNGQILRCNRAVADFTGISVHDLRGRNWLELIRFKEIEKLGPDMLSGEFHYPKGDRWFYVSYHPYSTGAGVAWSGAVVSIHETTDRKLAAVELEQAYAELKTAHARILQQEKMASIGQLAAGVAHEINNPIGFIMSNLGTMGKYVERITAFFTGQSELVAGLLDQEGVEREAELRSRLKIDRIMDDLPSLVAESLDGAERVKKIVQDLKGFSRVDGAEDVVVDLHECLESTINIVWNELKYKTTLVKDFGPLPHVHCRPQQLNQVFMNLLVNAAQAIEHQGTITVKTWQEKDMACISVTDTGIGIPEAIRTRIFEPFFTTKEVGKGTGLGLSISYDIIKNHGGELSVDSEVGQGTTFTIRIPVEPS